MASALARAVPPPLPVAKPVPLPAPYENVAQAFERAFLMWKKDRAEGAPAPAVETTVPVAVGDLVALLGKVENFAKYGASPETDALIWRLRAAVGVACREVSHG